MIRSIEVQVAAYNSDLNQLRAKNMVIKHCNGRSDIIIYNGIMVLRQAQFSFKKMQLSFKF